MDEKVKVEPTESKDCEYIQVGGLIFGSVDEAREHCAKYKLPDTLIASSDIEVAKVCRKSASELVNEISFIVSLMFDKVHEMFDEVDRLKGMQAKQSGEDFWKTSNLVGKVLDEIGGALKCIEVVNDYENTVRKVSCMKLE